VVEHRPADAHTVEPDELVDVREVDTGERAPLFVAHRHEEGVDPLGVAAGHVELRHHRDHAGVPAEQRNGPFGVVPARRMDDELPALGVVRGGGAEAGQIAAMTDLGHAEAARQGEVVGGPDQASMPFGAE